jgi:hypothetical protein
LLKLLKLQLFKISVKTSLKCCGVAYVNFSLWCCAVDAVWLYRDGPIITIQANGCITVIMLLLVL